MVEIWYTGKYSVLYIQYLLFHLVQSFSLLPLFFFTTDDADDASGSENADAECGLDDAED